MALQNMYNYKKPTSFVSPVKEVSQKKVKSNNPYSGNGSNSKLSSYQEQKILGAKPEELTLMLYEGIVKFLEQSKLYMKMGNIEKINYTLKRAQAIVLELQATLDMQYELSTELDALYDFLLEHMKEANMKKDVKYIDEALEIANELRSTWKEAMGSMR